jgi:hypothetical protein
VCAGEAFDIPPGHLSRGRRRRAVRDHRVRRRARLG